MIRARASKLADVAAATELDISTVSRVLNDDKSLRVAALTRERVLASAAALGYRPNPLGRGLRISRSYLLGISVPQLENPVFSQIIQGAEVAARIRGYSMLICHVQNLEIEPDIFERIELASRMDGLIVSTLEQDKFMRAALARTSLPIVLVNRRIRGLPNSVVFDGVAAAQMATERLLQAGHRRIVFLGGRLTGYNGLARIKGYKQALNAAGVTADASLIVAAGYTAEGGEKSMNEILDLASPPPTAVVAATLLTAAGALRALHERGFLVPEQMSIVSIQDAELGQLFYPQLTTIKMPLLEMGAIAADGLIDVIENRGSSVSRILSPIGLVERQSVLPPPEIDI